MICVRGRAFYPVCLGVFFDAKSCHFLGGTFPDFFRRLKKLAFWGVVFSRCFSKSKLQSSSEEEPDVWVFLVSVKACARGGQGGGFLRACSCKEEM